MSQIDLRLHVDATTCEPLAIDDHWPSLEEAAKVLDPRGFTRMGELGASLGRALLPEGSAAADEFAASLARAQAEGSPLRLLLTGDAAKLPMEFATLPEVLVRSCRSQGVVLTDTAIGLHPRVEIVRALTELEPTARPIVATAEEPIRVLIAVADPGRDGWPVIEHAKRQAEALQSTCVGVGDKFIDVRLMLGCSRERLATAFTEARPHVFHFVGHGADAKQGREPSLVLEASTGTGVDYLTAAELLEMCHPPGQAGVIPRLMVLNACHVGRTAPPATGFAEALSLAGVPFVVAMQLPVLDTIAEYVADFLYRPLLRGIPISKALAQIRRQLAVDHHLRYTPAWATPVFYSREADTSPFAALPTISYWESHARAGVLNFTGREWLGRTVTEHLESSSADVCLLQAESGMGKSSFLESYRRKLAEEAKSDAATAAPLLLAYRYQHGGAAQPEACARELAQQARQWLTEKRLPLPEEVPAGVGSSQYQHACTVLHELILRASEHTRVVMLLDALDQAQPAGDALPFSEPLGKLPTNLRVFATARPQWYRQWRRSHPAASQVTDVGNDSRFAVIDLDPLDPRNLEDIGRYLFFPLRNVFSIGINESGCIDLARRIRGNFLMAEILSQLLRPLMSTEQVRALFDEASSLSAVYELVFRSMRAELAHDPAGARTLRAADDLLALVSSARDPVSEGQLRYLFATLDDAEGADSMAHAVAYLRPYLDSDLTEQGEIRYVPAHPSLRRYGYRRLGRDTDFDSPLPGNAGNESAEPMGYNERQIADSKPQTLREMPRPADDYLKLWADYCLMWPDLERYPRIYALRNLVPHLAQLPGDGPLGEIEKTLTDYTFMAAALGADPSKRERPLHVSELIAQYELAEHLSATADQ